MSTKRYPLLSNIVRPSDLPDILSFMKEGITRFLDTAQYRKLSRSRSIEGDMGFYRLEVISENSISIELPGTGIFLMLNPDQKETAHSVFPITVLWEWKVLAHWRHFNLSNFSFSLEAMLRLGLAIFEVNKVYAINYAIQVFVVPKKANTTRIEQFVEDVNALYGTSFSVEPTAVGALEKLVDEISSQVRPSAYLEILLMYILSGDIQEQKKKLNTFFAPFLSQNIGEYIKDIVFPKFEATFTSSAGLEFPRSILTPVYDESGKNPFVLGDSGTALTVIPENASGEPKVMLTFGEALFRVDTEQGIDYNMDLVLNTNVPAQIGNTGLIITLQDLRIDLSKSKNIPQADADGRPADFMGVYLARTDIYLPSKWFKEEGATAKVVGKDLLIGTGGVSGAVGLEAISGEGILWANIGSAKGFKVGFKTFDLRFKQNKILSSKIRGALRVPKFVYPEGHSEAGKPVSIDVEGHLYDDGDFALTASTVDPYPITYPDVFTYHLQSLSLGREGDDFYIGTSGKIAFKGLLREVLKLEEISVEQLRIYSDGSLSFSGGGIALAEPIVLHLGPVEMTVTAIHYGAHQKVIDGVMRQFNYFGFDGGLSLDPLGVDIRGDGVKFYYCSDDLKDKPAPYLHLQTLHLDLTIPARNPVAIIKGWVSIAEPGVSGEYSGEVSLKLPKARIAASVGMKLAPRHPSFLIDASLDLPTPIPLGPFGIFGFRGLLGYRYVAEKEAAGLVSGVDSWYDYYKKSPRGVSIAKMNGPEQTRRSGTPLSIGAGASMGTSFDNGTIINLKAMALLSVPSLFVIDGRASLLSARLGLNDPKEPPFFAFIAIGDNSLEMGFGADLKLPERSGKLFSLYADVQAGFFFKDAARWYVHVGTKENPVKTRVLSLMTLSSYVMLSAKGIEAGARGEFNFRKKLGPVKIHAWAYVELGGRISFERPQIGAYLAAGLGIDIDIKVVSLYAAVDILFGVEAPQPFRVYGQFRLCVNLKVALFFTFEFCKDLDLLWEFNKTVDRTPINPLLSTADSTAIAQAVKGVHMLSNEPFELAYLGENPPSKLDRRIGEHLLPLDTYIDIATEKGLVPNAVADKVGGVNNPPLRYSERLPPQSSVRGRPMRQVTHSYSIAKIEVKSWNPTDKRWENYHPYRALAPDDPKWSERKIGHFQKTDGQYNAIRLLATTPFSYTEQGERGWYIPEQYGITSATLFCEGEHRTKKCSDFTGKPVGQAYHCADQNDLFYANEAAYFLQRRTDEDRAVVVDEPNPFKVDHSLQFDNHTSLEIRLPEPSVEVELKLSTHSQNVTVKYYAALLDERSSRITYVHPNTKASQPTAPHQVVVTASRLSSPVVYRHPEWLPVTRIEIVPQPPNQERIAALKEEIAAIEHRNKLVALGMTNGKPRSTWRLKTNLDGLKRGGCSPASSPVSKETDLPKGCRPEAVCYLYDDLNAVAPCLLEHQKPSLQAQLSCTEYVLDLLRDFNKSKSNRRCLGVTESSEVKESAEMFIKTPKKEGQFRILKRRFTELLDELNSRGACSREIPTPPKVKDTPVKEVNLPEGCKLSAVRKLFNDLSALLPYFDEDKGLKRHEYAAYAESVKAAVQSFNKAQSRCAPRIWKRDYLEFTEGSVSNSLYDLVNRSMQQLINSKNDEKAPLSKKLRAARASIKGMLYELNLRGALSWPTPSRECDLTALCQLRDDLASILPQFHEGISGYNSTALSFAEKALDRIHRFNTTHLECAIAEAAKSAAGRIFDYLYDPVSYSYGDDDGLAYTGIELSEFLDYLDRRGNCSDTPVPEKKELLDDGNSAIAKLTSGEDSTYYGKVKPNRRSAASETKKVNLPEGCAPIAIRGLYNDLNVLLPYLNYKELNQKNDWTLMNRKVTHANKVLRLIQDFDKKNPKCNLPSRLTYPAFVADLEYFIAPPKKSYKALKVRLRHIYKGLEAFLDELRLLGNFSEEEILYPLCKLREQILDIRNRELPHPLQVHSKKMKHYARAVGKIVKLIEMSPYSADGAFSSSRSFSSTSYAAAWEAVQQIIEDLKWEGNCTSVEQRHCHSLLHQVCWLSAQDHQFNRYIPRQSAISEDAKATIEGVSRHTPPIWRPNTSYYLHFVLKDEVSSGGKETQSTEYSFVYGFSTGGPVGHFHTHPKANYVKEGRSAQQYALTSLRSYIDYNRSYPNADGNLLNAKPLFYNDPTTRIYLFFTKTYAEHLFHNWPDYNGQQGTLGRIKIVIKDPREDGTVENPPYLDYTPEDTAHTDVPQTVEQWEDDPHASLPAAFGQYMHLFEDNYCMPSGGEEIVPPSSYLKVVPKHLKPLKLYTAIVNSLYTPKKGAATESREVHRFNFQTSRYASFSDQINSYRLTNDDPLEPVGRKAVFSISKEWAADEVDATYKTIVGNSNALGDRLAERYPHPYDRIVEGILGLPPAAQAVSTEFNRLVNTADRGRVIALLIRNPEPFNHPKIPAEQLKDTITVLRENGREDTNYRVLFSKDCSQALLMHRSREFRLPHRRLTIRFRYKRWNGNNYVVPRGGTVLVRNLIV